MVPAGLLAGLGGGVGRLASDPHVRHEAAVGLQLVVEAGGAGARAAGAVAVGAGVGVPAVVPRAAGVTVVIGPGVGLAALAGRGGGDCAQQ